MKEQDLRNALRDAMKSCQLPEYRKRQILAQMKGEEPVKKKLSVSFALVLAIMILTIGAAFALVHSNIANHLYGMEEQAPEALLEQIHTPQETASTTLGSLTLDEWLYDGHSLHTSLTISNPTGQTLLYTVDEMKLDDLPLDRAGGNLLMEGAGSGGLLLGGTVEGTSLPVSHSLYSQVEQGYLFDENGKFQGQAELPEGEHTLRIRVAVWRPVNEPKLVDYRDYEGEDVTETLNCLVTDAEGRCDLEMFRPEEARRSYNASQSGAEMYRDVFPQLGWAECVDFVTLEVPLNLRADENIRVIPSAEEYKMAGLTVKFTRFDMSYAGGMAEGYIIGEEEKALELLKNGLCLVDRQGRRVINNGVSWDTEYAGKEGIPFAMMLEPVSGEMPGEVWLAPVLDVNAAWDKDYAGPNYDPNVDVPENAVSIFLLDYDDAVMMELVEK